MIVQISDVRQATASERGGVLERQALEAQFVDGLGAGLRTALSTLEPVVLRLVNLGVTRKEITHLAAAKGFKLSYVRTLLSQILVRVGRRKRKPGAGPKTPALAKVILAFAREKAGTRAYKMLLAAAHAARKEDEAQLALQRGSLRVTEPVAAQVDGRYFIQIKQNPTHRHVRL